MTEAIIETAPSSTNRARPIGRILRFLMAGYFIVTVTPHFLGAGWQANLKIAVAIGGLIILYTRIHLVIAKYVPRLNRWAGSNRS